MKEHSKVMTALVTALLVSASSASSAAQTAAPTHKATTQRRTRKTVRSTRATRVHAETATERQMRELRELVSGEQVQIDALRAQLAARDQQVTAAQQSAAEAQSQVASAASATAAAAAQSTQNAQDVQQLKASVGDLSTQDTTLQQTVVQNQQQVQQEVNSPTAIHYKGVTFQPVGFFAFEGVWRERSLNSDVNTPFNSIPFPSAVEGHTSELNFSGRQSRLGLLVTGDAGKYRLGGYFEADFLGTGTSSNNNQSNSYVLRQRQIWGQAATAGRLHGDGRPDVVADDRRPGWHGCADGGFAANGRLAVPGRVQLGASAGDSVTAAFGDYRTGAVTVAMSLEQAQITNFTLNNATNAPADYFFAGPGQNGGLYNAAEGAGAGNAAGTSAITTYANNVAPDVLVKVAYDHTRMHAEIGGIARFFRDYSYPATYVGGTTPYTYGNHYVAATTTGGGAFADFRVAPVKFFEVGVQAAGGPGLGRYGSAQLADATLRPDGSLEPIHNYHGLAGVETHPTPKLDFYAYYGGEYAQRTLYANAAGGVFGYGPVNLNNAGCYALPPAPSVAGTGGAIASPSTCASPTKYIEEGMVGFTYRVVNSPRYGILRYQATYSYLQRDLWRGTVSTPVANAPFPTPSSPRAEDSMIHVSMRYYIP